MKVKQVIPFIHKCIKWEFSLGEVDVICKAHASDGLIYWCSHWEHIDRLADLGLIIRKGTGEANYHHRDFFLPNDTINLITDLES